MPDINPIKAITMKDKFCLIIASIILSLLIYEAGIKHGMRLTIGKQGYPPTTIIQVDSSHVGTPKR